MKIIFNDATELVVQSASIRADGSLLIKTISATEEELRTMFQDAFKTKKMTVTERESTIAEYENYTDLNAIVKYTAGILGVVMYREKESPMDRIDALEEHVDNLTEANKSREAENAELIATVDSILTDMMEKILVLLSSNSFIRILLIAVTLDTLLGVLRAIKEHKFNSCVGIDGAIRKAAMFFSVCLLMATDVIMHINMLGMVPEKYIQIMGIQKLGICEFFCLLFILYEAVSILKNPKHLHLEIR